MIKKCLCLLTVFLSLFTLAAQSDDDLFSEDFNEDALFGGGDDDFFFDDGIEEVEDVTATSDLSKGVLFENGSIKIGGNIDSSVEVATVLYQDNDDSFSDRLKDTTTKPNVGAYFTVDARPTQDLRMYTKFGLRYPFYSEATSTAKTTDSKNPFSGTPYETTVNTTVKDWIYLKEMFTDFSVADRAFFRFGLHTVTWGTGYFFSPVSDIINTSSINPEDVDAQVDGCFNLRTQITFPGTQNCLWFYVLPAFDYAKNTAFAGKFDLVLGGWELGLGGYYKYDAAPKGTITATGSLKKFNLFAEGVYQYGSDREWTESSNEKSHLFKATAGFSYMWKDPSILLAAQYYYDGNDFTLESQKDMLYLVANPMYIKENLTQGHNIALMATFGRIFGTTDLTATVFGMVNFGKEDLPATAKAMLDSYGVGSFINAGTFSAMLNYSPTNTITLGMGPYVTFAAWEEKPIVSLKLNFTLGGGKF